MPNKFQQIVFIGKTLNLCFMQKVPILLQNFVLVGRLYLYGIQGTEKRFIFTNGSEQSLIVYKRRSLLFNLHNVIIIVTPGFCQPYHLIFYRILHGYVLSGHNHVFHQDRILCKEFLYRIVYLSPLFQHIAKITRV